MPLARTLGVGAQANASAVATLRRTIALADDNTVPSSGLLVYGLPEITFYFEQTIGVLGCTVQPQFAVRSTTIVAVQAVEWLPLGPPVVINAGINNPTILQFTMPSRLVRVLVTRPAGQASTVELVIAAST